MSSISFSPSQTIASPTGFNPGAPVPAIPTIQTPAQPDAVELSPTARAVLEAGRIAVDAKSGNLTGSQATSLSSELSSIGQQIQTDKQANGGTLTQAAAQSIFESQNQFSQQIYTDSHSGSTTAPSEGFTGTDARQVFQAGRIALDENSGKLSSSQAATLSSQIAATQSTLKTDLQVSGGTLTATQAQAIKELQNQVSEQIYSTANPSGVATPQPVALSAA